jgi:hypothetical protein
MRIYICSLSNGTSDSTNSLSKNALKDAGIEALSAQLPSSSLTHLLYAMDCSLHPSHPSLRVNSITAVGALSLARAIGGGARLRELVYESVHLKLHTYLN